MKPLDERKSDTFQNVEACYYMQPPYINFLRFYEKSITFGSVLMSRIQITFQNVEHGSMQPSYINFLRYYKKPFTVGRLVIIRIQNTFHNLEVCYFMLPHILIFKDIMKIPSLWKRLDEQNSGYFLKCPSLLSLCRRHILISTIL